MLFRRLTLAFVLSLLLFGCGASKFKTFKLPVSANGARFTFPAIASVALAQGLEVARFDDSVHVRLDENTWAYFTVQLGEYNLVIQVDADRVPESRQAEHIRLAREKADRIWMQALAQLPFAVQATSRY